MNNNIAGYRLSSIAEPVTERGSAVNVAPSPLVVPRGKSERAKHCYCEKCSDRGPCMTSVLRLGFFARPECEQALPHEAADPQPPKLRTWNGWAPTRKAVYEYMQEHSGQTLRDIAAGMVRAETAVRDQLTRLIETGHITRERQGNGFAWRYYYVETEERETA